MTVSGSLLPLPFFWTSRGCSLPFCLGAAEFTMTVQARKKAGKLRLADLDIRIDSNLSPGARFPVRIGPRSPLLSL